MSAQDRLEIKSPSGRLYVVEHRELENEVVVYDGQGRRLLRVNLKGITAKAMIKRVKENIESGAPAYIAGWPPKDVDRILYSHAIACER